MPLPPSDGRLPRDHRRRQVFSVGRAGTARQRQKGLLSSRSKRRLMIGLEDFNVNRRSGGQRIVNQTCFDGAQQSLQVLVSDRRGVDINPKRLEACRLRALLRRHVDREAS